MVCKREARDARLHRSTEQDSADGCAGRYRSLTDGLHTVLQDEAGLELVENRLALKTAKHTLDVRSLPQTHPLWTIMNGMQGTGDRHKSPLFETWSRHHDTIQTTKAQGIMTKLPYVLPPWHDLRRILIIADEAEARRLHQRVFSSTPRYPLLYTDASVRNGLAGISVVMYNRQLQRPTYKVVYRETVGWEKTCTVTTAEICAIRAALDYFRESKSSGWIMTDSQEALRLIDGCGKSAKSRGTVLATLRQLQALRELGLFVKVLWTPGHNGIVGNQRAHQAAQQTTAIGERPTTDMERRVREHRAVWKLLLKSVEADTPEATATWGRYTYTMDSALPGKHTLQL